MQLIRITSDRVSIRTDASQLSDIKINDLLTVYDKRVSLVCIVSGITGHETFTVNDDFAYDGEIEVSEGQFNIIEASIIGSINDGVYTKSIDQYPTIDVQIEKIDDMGFSDMLLCHYGNTLRIGEYAAYGAAAHIDGNKFFQRHASIVGNTGSGKSVCVASILHKISQRRNANVILFDLHGEYKNLSFVKSVKIGADGMKFPIWFLPFRDIYSSFLRMKEETATSQIAVLRKAFYKARNNDKSENLPLSFDLGQLKGLLEEENNAVVHTGEYYKTGNSAGAAKTVKGDNNGKLSSVIALIEDKLIDKRYRFMIETQPQTYLYQFIQEVYSTDEKCIKALDLSDVPHEMVPVVVAIITSLIYQVQLQQDRHDIAPINIICEEAHVYIPSSDFGLSASSRRLLDVFETIAKEGRKFGTTLTIVSQRPSELNKTIMAQVENYIVLKMTNETDKQFIKSILPEGSRSIMDMLSLFSPGDCFAIGDASSIISKIQIDYPDEPPASNTIPVWDRWDQKTDTNVAMLVNRLLEG